MMQKLRMSRVGGADGIAGFWAGGLICDGDRITPERVSGQAEVPQTPATCRRGGLPLVYAGVFGFRFAAVCALAVLFAGGCAGKGKDDKEESEPPEGEEVQSAQADNPNLRALRVDTTRCTVKGMRADQRDLNHDGRADLVSIYKADGTALSCRQADFNFDGRLDAYFHYDDKGTLEREQFDLDYDGRIDIGRTYQEAALVLDEQDTNRDGFVDAWRRYDKGRLLRIETDRDGDGRADMFTYYLAGRIDRIGYDVNGDGRVDQWDHDAARRARLAEQTRAEKRKDEEDAAKTTTDDYVDEPEKDKEKGKDAKDEEPEKATPSVKTGDRERRTKEAGGKGDPKGKDDAKKDAGKGDAKKDAGKSDAKKDAGKSATDSAKTPAGDASKPAAPAKPATPQKPAGVQKPATPQKPGTGGGAGKPSP